MALWVKFRKYRSRGRPLKERERGGAQQRRKMALCLYGRLHYLLNGPKTRDASQNFFRLRLDFYLSFFA